MWLGVIGMINVVDLARYIVNYFECNNGIITNLKLQKILYYVQGYALRFLDSVAFEEDIYHWSYGPVVLDVYYEFNKFGSSNIVLDNYDEINISRKLKNVINAVVMKCFDDSAYTLVKKTHEEAPWKSTQKNDIITKHLIGSYFHSNDPLEIGDRIGR